MFEKRLIILGHPRSGTGYSAWVAQQYGLNVLHEKIGKNGISSWFWVTKDTNPPFGDGYTEASPKQIDFPIYVLRNPEDVILSTYFTEQKTINYRAEKIGTDLKYIDGAVNSYMKWFELSKKYWGNIPTLKIDDIHIFFEKYTNNKIEFIPKIINSRKHPVDKKLFDKVNKENLQKCWDLYNNTSNPLEVALMPHYMDNPSHTSFTSFENLNKIFKHLNFDPSNKIILDAGCGCGYGGVNIKKFNIKTLHGFDYSNVRVQKALDKNVYDELWIDDINKFNNEINYDMILCFEVLEHLENPRKVLDKIRKKGDVVGSVPLNFPYKAHLQVYTDQKDVIDKLNVEILWSDKKRVWFIAKKI